MPNTNNDNWLTGLCVVRKFIVDHLHIEPLSFGIILLLVSSVALLSLTMPIICCYHRQRRGSAHCKSKDYHLSSNESTADGRRRFLHLMFARLDEFESLTPLIVTPCASVAEGKHSMVVNKKLAPTLSTAIQVSGVQAVDSRPGDTLKTPASIPKHVLFPPPSPSSSFTRKEEERSPPPPRRCASGKTMIVPLCSNRHMVRQPLIVPAAGKTVLQSFEGNAVSAKSCETIPEDNELEFENMSEVSREGNRSDEEDGTSITEDLLSIDRTYVSTNDLFLQNPPTKPQLYYAPSPHIAPEFKIPPPAYSPPAPPPLLTPPSLAYCTAEEESRRPAAMPSCVNNPSLAGARSNLSSPEPSSSYGAQLDSPIETTTGSLSDSFLVNGVDGDVSRLHPCQENSIMVSELDLSSSLDNKYALHRIEEESVDGSRCLGGSSVFSNNGSCNIKRNNNNDSSQKFIPRSISQQLEIMNAK